MLLRFASSIFLLILVALPACRGRDLRNPPPIPVPSPVKPLRIGISDSAMPLETLIRSAYQMETEQTEILFFRGNDLTLLEELDVGLLDGILVYYTPDKEMYSKPVALDALVFFTNPDIQLSNIGLQTLRTLYTGTVTRWSTFGEGDIPITLLVREEGSGAAVIFGSKIISANEVSSNSIISFTETDVASDVGELPGAIGYGFMGSSVATNRLAIDGVVASPESAENEGYPLIAPIFFVSKEKPEGELQSLLSSILSTNGQKLVGENYGQVR